MSKRTFVVEGSEITVITAHDADYISLTDMARKFEDGLALIEKWLRNKNTVEFLGVWERLNNPKFNSPEFEGIMLEAGLNRFTLSVKKWQERTKAIGLLARAGRYGSGTYAHRDIAFEFCSWLSPEFKLYVIKEFQRLKEEEQNRLSLGWNLQRTLAKINYRIHTDAVKEKLLPPQLTNRQINKIYADEADLLNVAIFGMTAKEWRDANSGKEGNVRDYSAIEQLVVLSNLESLNAVLIHQGIAQAQRLEQLNKIAIMQIRSLLGSKEIKKLKQE